jgi:hypothetical protein
MTSSSGWNLSIPDAALTCALSRDNAMSYPSIITQAGPYPGVRGETERQVQPLGISHPSHNSSMPCSGVSTIRALRARYSRLARVHMNTFKRLLSDGQSTSGGAALVTRARLRACISIDTAEIRGIEQSLDSSLPANLRRPVKLDIGQDADWKALSDQLAECPDPGFEGILMSMST